jgi:hypothetical protein
LSHNRVKSSSTTKNGKNITNITSIKSTDHELSIFQGISTDMKKSRSSLYPTSHPPGSQVLVRFSPNECTAYDHILVWASSLFFVGSVIWVPAVYAFAFRKLRSIPKEETKRRAVYVTILLSATALLAFGPHRHPRVNTLLKVRKWSLWKSWLRFLAFEIVTDQPLPPNIQKDQAIVAVVPHGIFPFALAFTAVGEASERAFGPFRVVVASAVKLLPMIRDVLSWIGAVYVYLFSQFFFSSAHLLHTNRLSKLWIFPFAYIFCSDASRPAVDRALSEGSRLGLAPGGIREIYESYPKHLTHPDDEYSIVGHGIMRMAIKHRIPIIPVYCFGSTKLLKRLQLPNIVERISLMLRASLVILFGQWGLPVPFRQRLLYVIGKPIYPPTAVLGLLSNGQNTTGLDRQVDEMHSSFCEELVRIFDRHKESYGWSHKSLITLKR